MRLRGRLTLGAVLRMVRNVVRDSTITQLAVVPLVFVVRLRVETICWQTARRRPSIARSR